MKNSLLMLLALTLIAFSIIAPAQISPTDSKTDKEQTQKELEKQVLQILDQAVSGADALKLARNRAIIDAVAGDLYWKFDEKHARELFRSAGNEIIAANAESDSDKKNEDDPFFAVFDFSGVRNQILPLIAKHDADLALELLAQTRSAKLVEAMTRAAQPNAKQKSDYMSFDPDSSRVRAEIALEQNFAVLAAEQNPDKAVKLFKDSLSKGISWNVLPLLQKLNKIDAKKASDLADDLVAKIAEMDLSKKTDDLSAVINFMEYATNPNAPKNPAQKQFKFTDAQLKSIADKLFETFMQPTASLSMTMNASRAMSSLEKYIPEKAALLKQKQTEAMKNLPPELKQMQQREKIWNSSSTPEEILTEIPKLNEFEKVSAYQSINMKLGQIDDDARAQKIVEQIPDEKQRAAAREQVEASRINRAVKAGKLDEAKKLIGNLSKKRTRVQKLVLLAMDLAKKNTKEDTENALDLMKQAKELVSDYPEDSEELSSLMEIVKGYAVIKPDEAFHLFDPIVDQINETVQASAILSKYNRYDQNFKKGEMVMKLNGYSWDGLILFRCIKQIQMLGKADFNRTSLLSDKFTRNDARTMVKLFVAQGFLAEDKKDSDDENNNQDGAGMMIFN